MKKLIAVIISIVMALSVLMVLAVPCFAANMDKDGVYSVPVKMLDPKKDKESMGDRFIEHTAKITVKDGKKTITVLMPKESDLVFCYYVDGSVSGASKEATKESNVELDGKTYPVGYTFPLVKDNEPVGLYFELSFLGIKPSARLAPDYSKLKAVKLDDETTTAEEPADETTEVAKEPADETAEVATTIAEAESEETTEALDIATQEIIGGADEETNIVVKSESASPIVNYIAIAIAVIAIVAVVVIIAKKKKK